MVYIGTQYYRPPFPEAEYWEDDIIAMRDAGLNAVQLWVVWAWVESKPETYRFDDYDRIVELAGKHGLGVVLSTIAAVHPYWIHRMEPGSEMVDNLGRRVVSSNRGEIHFGITPGGCFDHPGVLKRMGAFLSACASRYAGNETIVGWDAWNELRWNVQADGLVCYCPNTLNSFRSWLDRKYGGLDGLNNAWKRRYCSWEDVLPGKRPDLPYTEMMAFQEFITWRSNEHAFFRYDTIKPIVGDVDVTVHGGRPSVLHGTGGYPGTTALDRGNDWVFAERIDGIGCSSFPLWGGSEMDAVTLHSRFEYLRSAAGSKKIWLSELQGGRYNIGFDVGESVDPVRQQRWIWNGYAIGADKVLFWCWRDEVFGRESNGFGFAGNDGMRAERTEAMRRTGEIITGHADLLESYRPDRPRIGALFSPESHYLYWSQEGTGGKVLEALEGYVDALVRGGLEFDIIESHHLDRLDGIELLFLPRIAVLDETQVAALLDWVRAGGRLVAESETGAFTSVGLYRYPELRPLNVAGVREVGRRQPRGEAISISSRVGRYELGSVDWTTPMTSVQDSTERLSADVDFGDGSILFVGAFPGNAYSRVRKGSAHGSSSEIARQDNFRAWICAEAEALGIKPVVELAESDPDAPFARFAKIGSTGAGRMIFVFTPRAGAPCSVTFDCSRVAAGKWQDLVSGGEVRIAEDGAATLPAADWGVVVLTRRGEVRTA